MCDTQKKELLANVIHLAVDLYKNAKWQKITHPTVHTYNVIYETNPIVWDDDDL